MSNTVDNRVVSLEFDNDQFEKNVQVSLATLEELKSSLNMSEATKSLSNIDSAVSNIDMSSLASSVQALENRFSTLGIVGMRVIENITDSLMSLTSKLTSFVTSGIISGGITRAMNLENAQFTLEGLLDTEEQVAAVMQDVNDAVDGTAYSLDAAAKVASSLTATGIQSMSEDFEDADRCTSAMYTSLRAVAGVAAMTNSEYSDIGDIFTTVAGNGRLMSEQLLQFSSRGLNAAATLADYLGTTESAVREMVSAGEIDFETFAAAMDDAFGEHAKDANKTFTGALSNIKSALARIGAKFVSPLIEQNGVLVELFNKIRTKVNEVSAALDPVASVFVDVAKTVISAVTTIVDKLNFTGLKNLSDVLDPLHGLEDELESVAEVTTTVTSTVEDFSDLVNQVILGDFGNGADRVEALTEAGYDWAYIQNLVNEKLGDGTRHATDYAAATEEVSETTGTTIDDLVAMSDAELENIGFTEDQIRVFRELAEQSEKTGISISDLIENVDYLDSQSLILNGFKNIGKSLTTVFKALGEAYKDIFPGSTTDGIYNAIAAFHKLTTKLEISDKTAEKLKWTFEGLFAALDIIRTIAGGGLSIAFKLISTLLGAVDQDILSVTAGVGKLIVKFDKWLTEDNLLIKGLNTFATILAKGILYLKDWLDAFLKLPKVQKIIKNIKKSLDDFGDTVSGVMDSITEEFENGLPTLKDILQKIAELISNSLSNIDLTEVAEDILAGLSTGLQNGVTSIPQIMAEIGEKIISTIKEVLGIASPAKTMIEVGKNIILGIIEGMDEIISALLESIGEIGNKIVGAFEDIDWGTVLAVGMFAGLLVVAKSVVNLANKIISPIAAVESILRSVGRLIRQVTGSIKTLIYALAFEVSTEGVKNLAEAVAILAGSIWLLCQVDTNKLIAASVAIGALLAIIGLISGAMLKMSKGQDSLKKVFDMSALSALLVGMGAAILLMAVAANQIAEIDENKFVQSIKGMGVIISELMALLTAVGVLAHFKFIAKDMDKIGVMLLEMSVAMLLMAKVVSIMGTMSEDEIKQGRRCLLAFAGIISAFVFMSQFAGKDLNKLGTALLSMTASMVLMVFVMKLVAGMSEDEIGKGALALFAFIVVISLLIMISDLASGKSLAGLAGALLGISASMLIMVAVIKLAAGLSEDEIVKGGQAMLAFIVLIGIMMIIANVAGGSGGSAKMAITLLAMAVAIGILVGICAVIGMLDTAAMVKGMVVVGLLSVFMSMMIKATANAKDCYKNLIVMSIAIGVMALAVAGLSQISADKLAGAVAALAVVMGMFSILMYASSYATGSMSTLLILTVVVALLGGILYELASLPIENTLGVAASLSILLLALSASLVILNKVGSNIKGAIVGIASLAALIGVMTGVIYVLGVLMENVEGMEDTLDSGIVVLGKIGEAIGSFISGIGVGLTDGLPEMGQNLSDFMTNLETFLDIAGDSNTTTAAQNASTLMDVLKSMAGADIMSSIAGMFGGEDGSTDNLTDQFTNLGEAINAFAGKVSGISEDDVKGGVAAAEAIAALYDSMPKFGGLVGLICGDSMDLDTFGEQLPKLAEGIVEFCADIEGQNIDGDAVSGVCDAVSAIAVLYDDMPKFGGLVQALCGESMNLDTFGEQLPKLAEGLVSFCESIDGKGIDSTTVSGACEAVSALAALNDDMDSVGGVVEWFTGTDTTLDTFGSQIAKLGEGLVSFSDSVVGIDTTAISSATTAVKDLAGIAEQLTTLSQIKTKLGNFADKLQPLGVGVANFASAVAGADFSNTTKACAVITKIQNAMAGVGDVDTSASSFKSAVTKLAEALNKAAEFESDSTAGFISSVSSLSSMSIDTSGLTATAASVSSSVNSMMKSMSSTVSGSASSVTQAMKTATAGMATAISSNKSSVTSATTQLITAMINVIKARKASVTAAFKNLASSAATAVKTNRSSMVSAGKDLGQGLVEGINSKKSAVYKAAYALGQQAVAGEKAGQKSNSPSKATIKAGHWFGEGLVIGIGNMADSVYSAGYDLGDTAVNSMSNAISAIADAVNTDIDSEPTITPVLDLSNVTSGASAISDMLGFTPSVGVLSSVGSIQSMMSENQNGGNSDVVSAINKLGKTIGTPQSNTYNVNGVTYDDGSNIASAVQSIIRAARVERRT